jgi:hypothetical protein
VWGGGKDPTGWWQGHVVAFFYFLVKMFVVRQIGARRVFNTF